MTDLLFNRDFAVTIDTVRIAARTVFDRVEGTVAKPTLRVQFKAEKNLARDPNKAEVTLWNLAPDTRALMQKKNAQCIIEAGYVGNLFQIFSGQLFYANHTRQGTDWITTFTTADGIEQYSLARINESFKPGVAMQQILERAAKSLGVGMGNAAEKFKEGNYRDGITEFTKGIVMNGKSADVLDELMRTSGYEWSIQDGQLQVLREDEPTNEDAVLLTTATGMIGSPEFAEDKKDKHQYLKVRSLLQGTFKPGRLLEVRSRQVSGFFKADKVAHIGDTWGNDWYTDIEAVAV